MEKSIARQGGIAAVVGPTDVTIPQLAPLLSSKDGAAARYLLVLSDDPLGAKAVATMSRLQQDLPALTAAAGLGQARVTIDGDTAITAAIVNQTIHDLSRVALAALAANLLFLMLYLKAPLAPIVLPACSLLAIAATLGLTVRLFQENSATTGVTFYVPFAAAVVLILRHGRHTATQVWRILAVNGRSHQPSSSTQFTSSPREPPRNGVVGAGGPNGWFRYHSRPSAAPTASARHSSSPGPPAVDREEPSPTTLTTFAFGKRSGACSQSAPTCKGSAHARSFRSPRSRSPSSGGI